MKISDYDREHFPVLERLQDALFEMGFSEVANYYHYMKEFDGVELYLHFHTEHGGSWLPDAGVYMSYRIGPSPDRNVWSGYKGFGYSIYRGKEDVTVDDIRAMLNSKFGGMISRVKEVLRQAYEEYELYKRFVF